MPYGKEETMLMSVIQKIVVCLDIMGWEQDGGGLTFVKPSTGDRKTFSDWMEAYDFVVMENKDKRK